MLKKYRKVLLLIASSLLVMFLFGVVYQNTSSKNSTRIGMTNVIAESNSSNPTVTFDTAVPADGMSTSYAMKAKAPAFAKAAAAASAKAAAAQHSSLASTTSSEEKNNFGNRKVILSGSLEIETNKFDNALKSITLKTQNEGGYIENSNITGVKSANGNYLENRTAEFSIRIPSNRFEAFMTSVGTLGVVTSKTTNGEDITSQYIDNTARLNSQKIKEQRLLDILKKAKDLSDILALETELESTRYQIETLTGTLKQWDNLVDLSTVTLTLKEVSVKKPLIKKPVTLSDKIKDSFNSSIGLLIDIVKGSLVALVAIIPFALIFGAIAAIVLFFMGKKKNKKTDDPIE